MARAAGVSGCRRPGQASACLFCLPLSAVPGLSRALESRLPAALVSRLQAGRRPGQHLRLTGRGCPTRRQGDRDSDGISDNLNISSRVRWVVCPWAAPEGTAGGLYTPGRFESTEKKNQCSNGRFPGAAWPLGQQREEP